MLTAAAIATTEPAAIASCDQKVRFDGIDESSGRKPGGNLQGGVKRTAHSWRGSPRAPDSAKRLPCNVLPIRHPKTAEGHKQALAWKIYTLFSASFLSATGYAAPSSSLTH